MNCSESVPKEDDEDPEIVKLFSMTDQTGKKKMMLPFIQFQYIGYWHPISFCR